MAKKKRSIAEQVASLSQEKQDKIVKIGRRATILQLSVGIPWLILSLLGLWMMFNPPASFDYNNYDRLYIALLIWLVLGAVYILGIFIYVLVKYPYYSDARWRYITKMRKKKEKL